MVLGDISWVFGLLCEFEYPLYLSEKLEKAKSPNGLILKKLLGGMIVVVSGNFPSFLLFKYSARGFIELLKIFLAWFNKHFHLFLTAFSVLPLRLREISLHLLPKLIWSSISWMSSESFHLDLTRSGST